MQIPRYLDVASMSNSNEIAVASQAGIVNQYKNLSIRY